MSRPCRDGAVIACLGMLLLTAGPAHAEDEDAPLPVRAVPPPDVSRLEALCGPRLAPPPDPAASQRRRHPDTPVQLQAEDIRVAAGRYQLRGDALFQRLDQWLQSERLELLEPDGIASVATPFRYQEAGLNLSGREARIRLDEDRMRVQGADFRFWEDYARGSADSLSAEPGRTSLRRVQYSTCPPGDELWWLRAAALDLDHDEGLGRARHARVEIGGVPVFYSPWLTFPIDDRRRTGILPPSIGNNPTDGWSVRLPVYLNLAPHYDATLHPTWYQRRGEQLGGRFRYLQPDFEGTVGAEYLPGDDLRGEDRWQGHFEHEGDLPGSVRYTADINRVSDIDYLRDFRSGLVSSSPSELESRATIGREAGVHAIRAEATHYQTLRADEPEPSLRRMPAIHYQFRPDRWMGLEYGLDSEAIRYALADESLRDTGERYHAEAVVSRPWRRQAFYVEPKARFRHTRFQADPADPGITESATRSVPSFSIDSGLFLERPFRMGGRPFLQTLEPRLFYLYTPFRNQDDLPVFETTERTFTVAQLFSENRFTDVDRIGDADQVSAALTTRLLDPGAGRERARASIAQVHYRRDREVTLPGGTPDRRSRSDVLAEAELDLPWGWSVRAEYVHDPDAGQQSAGAYRARWQARPRTGSVLRLDYRRREARSAPDAPLEVTQEQVDAAAIVPFGARWRAFTAAQYSLRDRVELDLAAGFEYGSCCWTVRSTVRRYQRGTSGDLSPENAVMLELDLRGLGRLGDDTAGFIQDMVPGHDDTVF